MSNVKSQKMVPNLIRDQKPYFLLFFLFIIISACDKDLPIQEDKFIKVYVDLLIIQDTTTAETFPIDSVRTLVFAKHTISSEQYDETISYYNSRPEKWAAFFDSAKVYVERLK
ncbi:MAG: DUF4296 domain-containing protein, partial [Ignavibacteriaceae bacterium]|nr:DUF4296 domain-containing protein [Ignavibacteriaceae bacterium]